MLMPFGEWLPDQASLSGPETAYIENAFPGMRGYLPVPSMQPSDFPTNIGQVTGGKICVSHTGTVSIFYGTADKIYRLDGPSKTLVDVSKAGGYGGSTAIPWTFRQFGDDVAATNGVDVLQYINLGAGGLFADIPDAAAKGIVARYMGIMDIGFLVLGDVTDTADGRHPDRIRWCALNNIFDWEYSASTQAGRQDIPDNGHVLGVEGGKYATVLMGDGVQRVDYIGGAKIMNNDAVVGAGGCLAPHSVIRARNEIFYFGTDGIKRFNGLQEIPIGSERVDRTLLTLLDLNKLDLISKVHDPRRHVILWGFQSQGAQNDVPDMIWAYNYTKPVNRFSPIFIDHDFLTVTAESGIDIDSLASIYPTIDEVPISLDSPEFQGSAVSTLAAFKAGVLHNWSGPSLGATLDTSETQFSAARSQVNEAMPLVDGGDPLIEMQIGTRRMQNDPVKWTARRGQERSGVCKFRADGRYHRGRVHLMGEWNHALGVDIPDPPPTGAQ